MNTLLFLLLHLICMYLTTVVISAGMFMGLYLKMYKHLADAGLKFDLYDIKLKLKVLRWDGKTIYLKKAFFIFGYNVILMLYNTLICDILEENMLNCLEENIVEFTTKEQKIYEKHPNGLMAYLITKISSLGFITFNMNIIKNNEVSKIKCLIIKDDFHIIKVEGFLKGTKLKELKQMVYNYLAQMIMMYSNEFNSEEEMLEYLSSFDEFTLNMTDDVDLADENIFTYKIDDGEIIWKYTDDYQDFKIITAFGKALDLTTSEQRKLISDYLKDNSYDTPVEYFDADFHPAEKLSMPNDEDLKLVRNKNKKFPH